MKIAIVGSQGKHWTPAQRTLVFRRIFGIIGQHDPRTVILVSGGCGTIGDNEKFRFHPGVDGWAELVADMLSIPKDIKYAEIFHWRDTCEDPAPDCPYAEKKMNKPIYCTAALGECRDKRKGFKTRNLEIAEDCDLLYCIEPKGQRSGGRWTLEQAEKMGKETHLIAVYTKR